MTMQAATKGRIVHVIVPKIYNNGDDVAPAIVTRAWGVPVAPQDVALPVDNEMGHNPLPGVERQTINVRILLDASGSGNADPNIPWQTSILLFQSRPTAEQLAELALPGNPTGEFAVAFWPPVV